MNASRVREWKAEYRGLCQRGKSAELERRAVFGSRSSVELGREAEELRQEDEGLESERSSSRAVLKVELERMRLALIRAQEHRSRHDLRDLDEKLGKFRSSMRTEYEALRSHELRLQAEVESYRLRFERWEKVVAADEIVYLKRSLIPKKKEKRCTPDEASREIALKNEDSIEERVAALNQALGFNTLGNWPREQHEAFVRLWQQKPLGIHSKNQDEAKAKLHAFLDFVREEGVLRTVTDSAIIAHCQWYAKRLALERDRRQLLAEWREHKEEVAQQQADEAKKTEAVVVRPKIKKTPAEIKEKERRAACAAAAKAWRQLREDERKATALKKEREAEANKGRDREKRLARAAKQRAKLDAYKKEKLSSSSAQANQPPAPPDKKTEKAERKARLEANAQKALKAAVDRRTKVLNKVEATTRSEERLRRLAADYAPSPSKNHAGLRLLQPTTASKFRELTCEDVDDYDEVRDHAAAHSRPIAGGGYDLNFAGRAVPSWRRPS